MLRRALLTVAGCVVALPACGYRSLASAGSGERLCVVAAPSKVPDLGAVQQAMNGARGELARSGQLGPPGAHPCLVLELLRVDEVPAGISEPVPGSDRPLARGTGVAVVGRAWVEQAPGTGISRDTGDVRRVARLQLTAGPSEGQRHDRTVATAAHELGSALARSVLGLPVARDELP